MTTVLSCCTWLREFETVLLAYMVPRVGLRWVALPAWLRYPWDERALWMLRCVVLASFEV